MQGAYGGLIIIIMYAGSTGIDGDDYFLITQNNTDILTQSSLRIFTQE
jgi:hypothetical protein